MKFKNIPAKMREMPHWIVWRLEDNGGKKPTKIPYCAFGEGYNRASVNDPNTWTTFSNAIAALEKGNYSGIGFVFTGTPFVGIDIDGCIDKDTGSVAEDALEALEILQSYTEISQSGSGFHIIMEGDLPSGRRRKGAFEMYGEGSNRYFAMTGNLFGEYNEIRADQDAINMVHQKYINMPESDKPTPVIPSHTPSTVILLSDQEVIERAGKAKNGSKFHHLWMGDLSSYDNDHSRADFALCSILAFWCRRDHNQIDRLFRQSGLMRPKWDELRGADTYGNMTIGEAIAQCQTVYQGNTGQPSSHLEGWEAPVPFETIDVPDFPVHSLPAPLASFVDALSESTQTPKEMAGILSLGVLATAFQSRYMVEINSDWKEPLCLYTLAIAPPADRKSSVISALTRPIYEYEDQRREEEKLEVAQNKAERERLESALKKAQNKGSKEDVKKCSAELSAFPDKYPFQLLTDDTTQEKLVENMEKQGGCITIASSEGGIFDMMSGRYDRCMALDVYLKGHSGDPITVERIGRKKNNLKHPRLSMILTVQPEVLNGLMENKSFKGRGLCGRFLYAVCRSMVGRRNVNANPIPAGIKDGYNQFIKQILSDQDSGIIYLSEEAHKIRISYAAKVEKRLGDEWDQMGDWGGKLVGSVMRIAALIHAAEAQESPTKTPISPETMTAAIEIAECLSAHATAAYQTMSIDSSIGDAKYLWGKIKEMIKETNEYKFSKNSLFDKCKGKNKFKK